MNNSLRDKISPIKSPLQVNNSNANTLNFNLSASPTNGKKLQTVKIEKYDDGEILEIINSMSQYPDDEDVQQYGCKQFGVLAKENIQTCQYLGKIDGIQLILNAMRNCPNAKRVLVDATFAITNFIKDDNNRLMAIEKGAIEMIRSALDTFDGDAELIEVAYPCLTLLGEDVEEEKRQLKDKFGIDGFVENYAGQRKRPKCPGKSLLGYRYISTRPLHRDPSTTNFQKGARSYIESYN